MGLEADDCVTVSKVREEEDGCTAVDAELVCAMSDITDINGTGFHCSDDCRTICKFNQVDLEALFLKCACLNCCHYGAERCIVRHIGHVQSLERCFRSLTLTLCECAGKYDHCN